MKVQTAKCKKNLRAILTIIFYKIKFEKRLKSDFYITFTITIYNYSFIEHTQSNNCFYIFYKYFITYKSKLYKYYANYINTLQHYIKAST